MFGIEHLYSNAIILGLIIALWSKVKILIQKAFGSLIVTSQLDNELSSYLYTYLNKNWNRCFSSNQWYVCYNSFIRPLNRTGVVVRKQQPKDVIIFRKGYQFIFLQYQSSQTNSGIVENNYIYYPKFFSQIENVILEAVDYYEKNKLSEGIKTQKSRFKITKYFGVSKRLLMNNTQTQNNNSPVFVDYAKINYYSTFNDHLRWNINDLGEPYSKSTNALDLLWLDDYTKICVDEVRKWKDSKNWFISKDIHWRRGWLLYGVPGSGKTTLARCIAQDLDLPIFYFDISSMSNKEFVDYWKEAAEKSPCMIIIEDIDNVFSGRKNIKEDAEISFDCLLNTISGIERYDGVFLIVTTNHISKVDDALTRPGRLDRTIKLDVLPEEGRRFIANRLLSDHPQHIEPLVSKYNDVSGAKFQEACTEVLLKEYWGDT